MTYCRLILALPLVLVLAAGCSSNKTAPATVSGKVNYKGQPVTAGTMSFYPKDGGVYNTSIKPDGTYSISDLPVGETTVTVETESSNPKKQVTEDVRKGQKAPIGPKPEGWTQTGGGAYVAIPAKYGVKETSGVTFSVTKGKQEQNIDLTD